jgi:enoyl-CoA hydratase/carnithine racemase
MTPPAEDRRPVNYETIRLETDGAVARLSLDRPAVLNAINRVMIREIHSALDRVEADEAVRVLIVQGTGRAFSAGFDLKESAAEPIRGVAAWREVLKRDLDMTMRFWRLAKPTIAAVHGFCLAGACELAVACDITIAADDAVFGEPELRFGSGIVTLILPWIVGPKRAKELLLTGNDRLSATEAHAMGLVNRVVPRAELEAEALRVARTIAVMDGGAVRLTKEAINRAADVMGLAQALEADGPGRGARHARAPRVRRHPPPRRAQGRTGLAGRAFWSARTDYPTERKGRNEMSRKLRRRSPQAR